MKISQFKMKLLPGLRVDIVVPEGEYAGKYRTRIEEVGETIIAVGTPFEKSNIVPLRIGTNLKLIFWDEVSAYSFATKIKQKIAVPIHMLLLELPETIVKVQRRNYVRVTAIYPFIFQIVTLEGFSDDFKGTMLDFSGGGIRFLTEELVEDQAILNVSLDLTDGRVQTKVQVLRIEETEERNLQRYCVSAEFIEISERSRDRIIRSVFEKQRTMRKKGLE
ncbi:flagellar brake protein YcgR [Desulfosporosinus acididurans]|uniref:Flagellar brake protein YcgR n=1 Tax=Desulfosporosinus acididurans TaxID=476652 RepID=A0A0J1FSU8_9FIRM|nr:flagellar brake domain-containing protein [Desulfosporosinus acididurans]KLU66539.1 flagellar brake protein YcgR [Desulfosporosinus acididurans]